ncbi:hypothetical protein BH11PAT2_BH11PAT2_01900 [soil metagenome]
MNQKNKMITSAVVVLIVVAGVSFYGGITYAQGKGSSTYGPGAVRAGQFGATAMGGARTGARTGGFAGAGGTAGKVIAKDDKSITVQLPTGGSKIVFVTSTTPVSKDSNGTLADVAVGTEVIVAGTANADGSISAQSVRIGGTMMTRGTTPTVPAMQAQ